MIFQAEITEIKVKKTVSNDKEFRITLITDNPDVIQLEKVINDRIVEVEIK